MRIAGDAKLRLRPERLPAERAEHLQHHRGSVSAVMSSSSPPPSGQSPQRPGSGRTHPTKKQRRRQASSRTPVKVALRPWWQSPVFLGGVSAGLVVVLVVVLIAVSRGGGATPPASLAPVPASVLSAVEDPSASLLSAVGAGGQPGQLKRIAGTQVLKDASGKVEVVYVGAEYCPYCAATRWPMIMALSRFGTFKNLKEMTSSSTDVDPNTHTFAFLDASYSSQWVDFQPTESFDRNDQPLQSPSAQVAQVYSTYDQAPYTGQTGALPFLDIANRFSLYQTIYDPAVLAGLRPSSATRTS
jgi:thiol-disulfide isomerase/thioredoxin